MLAAKIFNQRQGIDIPVIYGVVTSGTAWRFLTLKESYVCIDLMEYYINQVDVILAILLKPIQSYFSNIS